MTSVSHVSSQAPAFCKSVAIIGSGPTGIYTLKGLTKAQLPLRIVIFEIEADPGKGTPYHPHINDQAMLANIASLELPPICESLLQWLQRQNDEELDRLGILRANIGEREFYPRVVLGEYFHSQFHQVMGIGRANGHTIDVRPLHRVVDIALRPDDILLTVNLPDGERKDYAFDHVVMATGHDWPERTETKPGYFVSPWPAPVLKAIAPGSVGILGTSLSAIDALITIATAHGSFYYDATGELQYQSSTDSEGFRATMMSRKGLLPEADFYFDYPYPPLQVCTADAVMAFAENGTACLLDEVFELFRQELTLCDADYAAKIGLSGLTADSIASAYFAAREESDPFVWAAANLAEAELNKQRKYTVQWRCGILRMHEVIALAVPFLTQVDLKRFNKGFKSVFVDDYATVPHQSIHRVLALRRANKLQIRKLGENYQILTDDVPRGASVKSIEGSARFEAFVDATGQESMSAKNIPFPTLVSQGVVKPAATRESTLILSDQDPEPAERTGGVDLDACFRPKFAENLSDRLYCAAISFLLHKMPFVQGITSAHEIGCIVSKAIIDDLEGTGSLSIGQRMTDALVIETNFIANPY